LEEVKVLDDVKVIKKRSWPWSRSSKVKVMSEVKILVEGQDVEEVEFFDGGQGLG
jgi:hypothetical protein